MTTTNPMISFRSSRGWLDRCFKTCALVSLFALFSAPLSAQSTAGTVTGTVIDASTGKFLQGAEVSVENTPLRTTTLRDGSFQIANVPVGSHNLVVNYQGFEPKTTATSVTAGQNVGVAIQLGATGNTDVVKLGEFKVAGTKEGMAQAVSLQKMSVNAKVVAAGDQYGDIAEGNAAEYLKFLPGVGIDYNANDARAATLRGMNTAVHERDDERQSDRQRHVRQSSAPVRIRTGRDQQRRDHRGDQDPHARISGHPAPPATSTSFPGARLTAKAVSSPIAFISRRSTTTSTLEQNRRLGSGKNPQDPSWHRSQLRPAHPPESRH